jgi:hypothetical protein
MKITLEFCSATDAADFIQQNLVSWDHSDPVEMEEWYKTLTKMQQGWPEGASVVHDILYDLSLNDTQSIFKKDHNQMVTGLFFDVGLICSKIPECWIDPQTDPYTIDTTNQERIIRLGMNSVSWGFSPSSIIERGAAIAALAYILQQMGHNISLTQYYATTKNNHSFQASINHILDNQSLNIEMLSFWLACPDSLHKCWSQILKTTHDLNIPVNEGPTLIPEYGRELCDIFIPGAVRPSEQWSRNDSLSWIRKIIQEQKNAL